MEKKKNSLLAWITAGLAILGVIILLTAVIFAVVFLNQISDECSNFSGEKPYFITAVSIAGTAMGIQIASIVMAIVVHFINKTKNAKVEGSASV